MMLLTSTTGHMSHMEASYQQKQMKWLAISTNQAYQCSLVTRCRWRIRKFMKAILIKPNIVSTDRCILHLQVLHINGNFTTWKLKLSLKRYPSVYEVDLAALVVSVSSSSGKIDAIKTVNKPWIIQWSNAICTAQLKDQAIHINLDIF